MVSVQERYEMFKDMARKYDKMEALQKMDEGMPKEIYYMLKSCEDLEDEEFKQVLYYMEQVILNMDKNGN